MPARDLHYCELVEVGQRIQKRDLSAVEATQAQLDRIARLDGKLKATRMSCFDDMRISR
jgi:amidase